MSLKGVERLMEDFHQHLVEQTIAEALRFGATRGSVAPTVATGKYVG
ncbi:MAG: hypothetical protein ACR65T_06185 [Methylocystis sp.]|jgi:hypothetical protein